MHAQHACMCACTNIYIYIYICMYILMYIISVWDHNKGAVTQKAPTPCQKVSFPSSCARAASKTTQQRSSVSAELSWASTLLAEIANSSSCQTKKTCKYTYTHGDIWYLCICLYLCIDGKERDICTYYIYIYVYTYLYLYISVYIHTYL